jgi:enediyne biosynthesis protein E4
MARRRRFRISVAVGGVLILAVVAFMWFKHGSQADPVVLEPVVAKLEPIFVERAAQSGIKFSYHNGQEAGNYAILESLGGGVALLDYDGDGLLDVFVTGGGYFSGKDKKEIRGYPCKLYKNLGNWKFKDVTHEVGLDKLAGGKPWFYTHGAAVADYDNDGFPDLLVTGYGRVALFHNVKDPKTGGRRFQDVTSKAGLNDKLWSTSAAWADFDGDGYPDLYICHYVNWSWKNHPTDCAYGVMGPNGKPLRDVCPPKKFEALPHVVYHNNGNGTFTDVSKSAGILEPNALKQGKGLGVVVADFNGDGKPDVYVATDEMDNLLYINKSTPGHIYFEENAVLAGVARDDNGAPNGSMGVTVGDYDGSGNFSIFVANYEKEAHALYRNRGDANFSYCSQRAGISAIGLVYVGFGTGFIDYDNDGNLDLFVADGHVIRHPTPPITVEQRPVLLRNMREPGQKPFEVRFDEVTKHAGPYFDADHISRGAAFGDLTNNGRTDIVISNINEPVAVLQNVDKNKHHWLGVNLLGKPYRDAVGAKVVLEVNGQKLTRTILGGGSYCSASDHRIVFGLGDATKVGKLTVTWPNSNHRQQWTGLAIDQYHLLEERDFRVQDLMMFNFRLLLLGL